MNRFRSDGPRAAAVLTVVAIVATTGLALPVYAQTSTAPASEDAKQNVQKQSANQPAQLFQVDAGYQVPFGKFEIKKNDRYFYKIQYNGNILGQGGTAFKDADFTTSINAPTRPEGDTNDFLVRLERGALTSSGPLFDLLKLTPLSSQSKPNNYLSQIRGAVQVYGQVQQRFTTTGIGIELPPIVPSRALPPLRQLQASNWLVIGLQAASQSGNPAAANNASASKAEDTSSTDSGTKDSGRVTYRFFLGRALGGNVQSRRRQATKDAVKALLTEYADTPENFNTNRAKFATAPSVKDFSTSQKQGLEAFLDSLGHFAPSVAVTRLQNATNYELDSYAFLKEVRTSSPAANGTMTDAQAVSKVRSIILDYLKKLAPLADLGAPQNRQDPDDTEILLLPAFQGIPKNVKNLLPFLALSDANRQPGEDTLTKENDDDTSAVVNFLILQRLLQNDLPNADLNPNGKVHPMRQRLLTVLESAPAGSLKELVAEAGVETDPVKMGLVNRKLLALVFPQSVLPTGTTWQAHRDIAVERFFLLPDRPRAALWLDDVGHYTFSGFDAATQGAKVNNIFAATATYWFNPQEDKRQWIRARYENGRDKAEPTVYKNRLLVTLGFDL